MNKEQIQETFNNYDTIYYAIRNILELKRSYYNQARQLLVDMDSNLSRQISSTNHNSPFNEDMVLLGKDSIYDEDITYTGEGFDVTGISFSSYDGIESTYSSITFKEIELYFESVEFLEAYIKEQINLEIESKIERAREILSKQEEVKVLIEAKKRDEAIQQIRNLQKEYNISENEIKGGK